MGLFLFDHLHIRSCEGIQATSNLETPNCLLTNTTIRGDEITPKLRGQ